MTNRKQKTLFATKVIKNIKQREDTHYLYLEKKIDFIPGQVIALALTPEAIPRLYSIASGATENYLGILFDIKTEGELTPLLSKVKEGDLIYISEPFGNFICEDIPATWIATGTGIAPFVAMVNSGINKGITLLHGARTLDKFFFEDTFKTLLNNNYLRFCTTEMAPGIENGRLTNYLKAQTSLPTDNKYYLCGSSQMVIDVREILLQKGVPFDNIIAEIYF